MTNVVKCQPRWETGKGGRWIALLNPRAKSIRSREARLDIVRQLGAMRIEVSTLPPPGERLDWLRRDAAITGIVVCGGDGSVFSVINAMDRIRQTLAVIPCGRGNSLARDLGCGTIVRAIAALKGGRRRRIDLIAAELSGPNCPSHRLFAANALAFGPLADAIMNARHYQIFRNFGYTISGLFSCPSPQEFLLATNGKPSQRLWLGGIALLNSRHLGRYRPCSDAFVDDGLFEVVVQPASFLREKLLELRLFAQGTLGPPARRSRKAQVIPAHPSPLYVDGELFPDIRQIDAVIQPRTLICIHADLL